MGAHDILRYAVLAGAHLLSELSASELGRVRQVVLFGSAARLAATEESDIDLFFDTDAPERVRKALRAKLAAAADRFALTNAALRLKSAGVANEISVRVGRLEEWESLAQSIASYGIVLYGAYTAKPRGLAAYTVLSWEAPGKAKGALLNKLYGYVAKGKRYPGLLEKKGGVKLGRATILVPARERGAFIGVLEHYRVDYSRRDVWG